MDRSTTDLRASADLVVIGGGLAGVTAAAVAASSGLSVTLLEQARSLGGRAATNVCDGVHFNLGPRALFRQGPAHQALVRLGVPVRGTIPNPGRSIIALAGRRYLMPVSVASLIRSRLLSLTEKFRFAGLLQAIPRFDPRAVDRVCVGDWVREEAGTGRAAQLLQAFLRLSTYGDDPRHLSAGAALDQLQLALRENVLYLDGGWQTLVDALRDLALANGATIRPSARIDAVHCRDDGVVVQVGDGTSLLASAAIFAADPRTVAELLVLPPTHAVSEWSRTARPARAACLDIALTRLPRPHERFALGLDRPLYFSVHSAAATLAPPGIAVMHVMKYLSPDAPAEHAEQELEAFLDTLQPGWRQLVHTRRFLPNMVVTHGLPLASHGGAQGRPAVAVADRPRVFLAGDWVGPVGQLADAAVSSAEMAVGLASAAGTSSKSNASTVHAAN